MNKNKRSNNWGRKKLVFGKKENLLTIKRTERSQDMATGYEITKDNHFLNLFFCLLTTVTAAAIISYL
jgi:hypothetical protein